MSEAAYRVEVASSGRAVCKDSLCKSNGVKIKKDELRFATWVSSSNDQWSGFQYKHWGCVSGKILENIRNNLLQGDPEGEYQWDYLDGLSDLNEEFQNKVKTAIIEGKIADEDFKGDPAYNQLGKKGIRGRASTQKPAETGEVNTTLHASETPAKSPAKKRRTKKVEDDSAEEDDAKPTKNSRAKKRINKGGDATEEDEKAKTDAELPKKARSKKSVKEKEDDAKPTKNSRAKNIVSKGGDATEEDEEKAETDAELPKKARSKKSVKAKEDDAKSSKNSRAKKIINKGGDATEEDKEKAETDAELPKKARSKKSVKANIESNSVKEDNDFDVAKPTGKLRSNEIDPDVRPAKRRRGKAAKE